MSEEIGRKSETVAFPSRPLTIKFPKEPVGKNAWERAMACVELDKTLKILLQGSQRLSSHKFIRPNRGCGVALECRSATGQPTLILGTFFEDGEVLLVTSDGEKPFSSWAAALDCLMAMLIRFAREDLQTALAQLDALEHCQIT